MSNATAPAIHCNERKCLLYQVPRSINSAPFASNALSGQTKDTAMREMNRIPDAASAGRWVALVVMAWMALGATEAKAQEEEQAPPESAPEPFIPYSEQPKDEDASSRELRNCEVYGYVGCVDTGSGKPAAGEPRRAPKPDVWGALAVSASTLASGTSWNYNTADAANQAALDGCRERGGIDCKIVKSVADVCVSLAVSSPQKLFTVGGPTGAGNFADDAALLKCRRAGGKSCIVQASFCADGERHDLFGHTVFSNGNPIFVPDNSTRRGATTPAQSTPGDATAMFYGTWIATVSVNGQSVTIRSVHNAQGYQNAVIAGTTTVPSGGGTFSAAKGRYWTSAATPNDTGTYRFLNSETAVCTNAAGQTVTWKRIARPVDANTAAKALTGYSPRTQRPGVLIKK